MTVTAVPAASRVPVTVIGGFLGAGKTTLLNSILHQAEGLRIAAVVNDFGQVNIDEALIVEHRGDTIALTNGCVCCDVSGGLPETMTALRAANPPFDHIVIEASGIGDPWAIGQYGTTPGFRLDGVVVLVDAENAFASAADPFVGAQMIDQLSRPDLVLLTKADLVSADHSRTVSGWIRSVAGDVEIVNVVTGSVPLAMLLGIHRPMLRSDVASRSGGGHDTTAFATRTYVEHDAFCVDAHAVAEVLAGRVLRAKGFFAEGAVDSEGTVDSEGASGRNGSLVLHVVGRRHRVYPGPAVVPRAVCLVVVDSAARLAADLTLDSDLANLGLRRFT